MLLLSAAGMVVMTTANDLIVVFVALEALSIPLYVLVAFDRRRLASQEAGIKYFVLGSFASAVFLYGVALVYGATGSTSLTGIAAVPPRRTRCSRTAPCSRASRSCSSGSAFKISAVPFHMWTPDVYQGAPSPVTAFMSSATKVAGFAAFLRIFLVAFPLYRTDWRPIIMALATLTLVVGTVAARRADRPQARPGVLVDRQRGLRAHRLRRRRGRRPGRRAPRPRSRALLPLHLHVHDHRRVRGRHRSWAGARTTPTTGSTSTAGLARRSPVLAGFLTFFLLAQAGVPFTGGFVAKLQVFAAAVDAREYWLAIVGVLERGRARLLLPARRSWSRFAGDDEAGEAAPAPRRRIGAAAVVVLVATGVMVLLLGIVPGAFLHFARDAASLI